MYKLREGKEAKVDDILDAYDSSWITSLTKRKVNEDDEEEFEVVNWEEDPGKIKDSGILSVKAYHKKQSKKVEPKLVEQEIVKHLTPHVIIRGRIDLVTMDGTIIDHKVKKRKMYKADADKDLQPTTYLFLLDKKVGNIEFHVAVRDTESIIPVSTIRTEEDVKWWKELVLDVAKQIDSGIYPPNPLGWHCLSPDTEILTREGWKNYDTLNKEEIATLDTLTDTVCWEVPTQKFKKPYMDDMVCYESKSLNFCVTPEHLMYSKYMGIGQAWKIKEAKTIENKGAILRVAGNVQEEVEIPYPDDLITLAGWASAEGHFRGKRKGRKNLDSMVEISQSKYSKYYTEIEDCIKRLGMKYSINHAHTHVHQFRLSAKDSKYLKEIQFSKDIPSWLLTSSQQQFELWLNSFMKGDGSFTKNGFTVSQKSEKMIDDLQRCCILHGYSACKSKERISTTKGKYFSLSIVKNRNSVAINSKSSKKFYKAGIKVPYVWCIALENNKLFFTRRNGRVVLVHNCNPSYCSYYRICKKM